MPISEDIVIAAYRSLLKREPESADVVSAHAQSCATQEDILLRIIASEEFRRRIYIEEAGKRHIQEHSGTDAATSQITPDQPLKFPESHTQTGGMVGREASLARIKRTGNFTVDDIELVASTFSAYNAAPDTPWDSLRESRLRLPDWFDRSLDPYSDAYRLQQHKLWSTITGSSRDYDASVDEQETRIADVDSIRFPAFYGRRDVEAVDAAAHHLLACGMIMKHSGLRPGQWALEYGAGFAQTALQLSRLGVNVDTVDISKDFCHHVKCQAEFFGVSLTPFEGRFGWNPRGAHKYDVIWFYESFHHCLEFEEVVSQLRLHLQPRGKILLFGEPVVRHEDANVPYAWGIRLHSECVAVIKTMRWFELGFSEDFLVELFTRAGFCASRIECPMSMYGEGYVFQLRPAVVELGLGWFPAVAAQGWHDSEANGRWTKERAHLLLDMTDTFRAIDVSMTNYHALQQQVVLVYGEQTITVSFQPGESKVIQVTAGAKSPRISFETKTHSPAEIDPRGNVTDTRRLGIFVHSVAYLQ